jgi:hypothetical protein
MTVSDVLALVGGITGPLGFLISLLVFFRDRPRIEVSASWGLKAIPPDPDYPENIVSVSVVNLGRRPAYVSHVSARRQGSTRVWLLAGTVPGRILTEGSPPYISILDENVLKKNDLPWWGTRFSVSTSSGKLVYSPWLESPPDWASSQTTPWWAATWNKTKNRVNRIAK